MADPMHQGLMIAAPRACGVRAALIISAVISMLGSLLFVHGAEASTLEDRTFHEEAVFVSKINGYRAEHALPPLTVDFALVSGARQWSETMAARGGIFHADDLSIGVADGWAKLGENVGYAPIGQLDELFDAFVASPSHRENLLDPGFDHVGVGVVHADDGRIYTTHRFMDATDAQQPNAMTVGKVLLSGSSGEPSPADALADTPERTIVGARRLYASAALASLRSGVVRTARTAGALLPQG